MALRCWVKAVADGLLLLPCGSIIHWQRQSAATGLRQDGTRLGKGLRQFETGQTLYQQAIAILEPKLGAEHPWTVRCRENLAKVENGE